MKKIIFLFMISLWVSIVSCTKDHKPDELENQENSIDYISKSVNPYRVIFRFTAKYGSTVGCQGEPCGICLGLCLKRIPKIANGPLSDEEIEDDYLGVANIEIIDGDKISITPDRPMENGSGYLLIEEDFDWGTEVPEIMGKSSIILKAGSYYIDYSENEFGTSIVDAEIE